MSKLFGFSEQLRKGLAAQDLFAAKWRLEQIPGKGSDFKLKNGQQLELKTDSRPSTKTGNLFIERYSSTVKKSDGGPWQALHHGSKWFVYQFTDIELCFETQALVEWLDDNLDNYQSRKIDNGNYITLGYLIPIADVSKLCVPLKYVIAITDV